MAKRDQPSATQQEPRTSATLLLRVREADDTEAWNEFVAAYAPKIFNWCRRFHLQETDAADITQDVLFKLVRIMRTFRYDPARGSFRGWLKTVTGNTVRDLIAQWQKTGRGSGDTAIALAISAIQDENAVQSLVDEIHRGYQEELLAEAERQVQKRVQPHTWQAYQLSTTEELSAADIARRLNMPVSEVYVAKSRVIKMLREYVKHATD